MTKIDLFNKIYEYEQSLKQLKKTEILFKKEIFGELKITEKNNGIIVNQHQQKNKVLIWAKHAMIKMISGQPLERVGSNRNIDLNNLTINNGKGTLVSGNDFFYNDNLSSSKLNNYYLTHDNSLYTNPYFPTKMLFGTGIADINNTNNAVCGENEDSDEAKDPITDDQTVINLQNDGWIQSVHAPGTIAVGGYDYYGMGVDKNYSNFTNQYYGITKDTWLPSFIYNERKFAFDVNSQIKISKIDESYDDYTKIKFLVKMPSQSDNKFYPYNNMKLKYAGLFCDAALTSYNGTGDDLNDSFFNNGMMWCKVALDIPITKTKDNSIDWEWTLYIPHD